ncbi:hypothetical protein ACHAQA_000759 [Verticillium albo-atrum]
MPDDLRRQLAKSKLNHSPATHVPNTWPWDWNEGLTALANGWRQREPRYPVLLHPAGPIAKPEHVQALAGLSDLPRVWDTTRTDGLAPEGEPDPPDAEEVLFCHVSWNELVLLKARTKYKPMLDCVWFQGEKCFGFEAIGLTDEGGGVLASKNLLESMQGLRGVPRLKTEEEEREMAELWVSAARARANGWRQREPRYPVLLLPTGPISRPEHVQALAELPNLPRVWDTTRTDGLVPESEPDPPDAEEVLFCHVSWDELVLLKARTEYKFSLNCVWFQGEKSFGLEATGLTDEGRGVLASKGLLASMQGLRGVPVLETEEEERERAEAWAKAGTAIANGWQPAERRYPILLRPEGPVSTPEHVQALGDMSEPPQAWESIMTDGYGRAGEPDPPDAEVIWFCHVSEDEMLLIDSRTENTQIDCIWYRGTKRAVLIVTALKEEGRAALAAKGLLDSADGAKGGSRQETTPAGEEETSRTDGDVPSPKPEAQ